jgi:hypothetical protein
VVTFLTSNQDIEYYFLCPKFTILGSGGSLIYRPLTRQANTGHPGSHSNIFLSMILIVNLLLIGVLQAPVIDMQRESRLEDGPLFNGLLPKSSAPAHYNI